MTKIPDDIKLFMEKYGVKSDEIWLVPGGRNYAIRHSAIERIGAKEKIWFDKPQIIEADAAAGIATVCVIGHGHDDTEVWSFGEASPKNNKNAYPWAMAEKRAKARVILKLVNAYGSIYSEDEADDFKQQPARQEAPPQASYADEYTKIALGVILKFRASADELRAWWTSEAPHREEAGIYTGSKQHQELYEAVKAKGHELLKDQSPKEHAA